MQEWLNRKYGVFLLAFALVCVCQSPELLAQVSCAEPLPFEESFGTTTYWDSGLSSGVTGWGEGSLRLSELSSRTYTSGENLNSFLGGGKDVIAARAVDVDLDGDRDILSLVPNYAGSGNDDCRIVYTDNTGAEGMGAWVAGTPIMEKDGSDYEEFELESCSYDATILVGNFCSGSSGQADILHLTFDNLNTPSADDNEVDECLVYKRKTTGSQIHFEEKDDACKKSLEDLEGVFWMAGSFWVVDWDGDGFDDILVGQTRGGDDNDTRLLYFKAKGNGGCKFESAQVLIDDLYLCSGDGFPDDGANPSGPNTCLEPTSYDVSDTPRMTCSNAAGTTPRGVGLIAAADFDGNGKIDIVAGGIDQKHLVYHTQDAGGNFTFHSILSFPDGGVGYAVTDDIDGDGNVDLLVARDYESDTEDGTQNGCGTSGAKGYLFKNTGGTLVLDTGPEINISSGRDIDYLMRFDLNNDDTVDTLVGDDAGNFEQITTAASTSYSTSESFSAYSKNINSGTSSVVSVQVGENLLQDLPTNTQILYFVSNNGGLDWESLNAQEAQSEGSTHSFQTLGSDLRLKVSLSTSDSTKTPTLDEITLSYKVVSGIQRYSRSAPAYGVVGTDGDGDPIEYLYTASVEFPGMRGYMTALNISDLSATGASSSAFERVDNHADVSSEYEVGNALITNGSRNIYTSEDDGSGGLTRVTLTSTNLSEYATGTDGDSYDFLFGGMGSTDSWKFYDPGHSSPIVVGEPSADPNAMGTGYQEFITSQTGRSAYVYIGSNGGTVHAFRTSTGREAWAYVPKNLLGKLDALESSGGEYAPQYMVDGSVLSQDVYIGGAWKTILVGGQAKGTTVDGAGFYYALDITNQTSPNPLPLWEFSEPDPVSAASRACQNNAVCSVGQVCCTSPYTPEEKFCAPGSVEADCTDKSPTFPLGETWSKPLIVPVNIDGTRTWVVLFGSGYDPGMLNTINVGRTIFMVDALDGTVAKRWTVSDLAYDASTNPSTINNTVVSSPAAVDLDSDGNIDRFYIGDLEGRLWKHDVSSETSSEWTSCVLFDAGDPDGDGTRTWAPIITKPAIGILKGQKPTIYFGTGGDRQTPSTLMYKFFAVYDDDEAGTCRGSPKLESTLSASDNEWVVGDGKLNTLAGGDLPSGSEDDEGVVGERYWSDPVLVNNSALYFASIPGTFDTVNLCDTTAEPSRFYGYAAKRFKDASGQVHEAGSSILGAAFLEAGSQIGQGVVVRSSTQSTWAQSQPLADVGGTDVIIQEMTQGDSTAPALKRLGQVGYTAPVLKFSLGQWRLIAL
jgi:hypothetical protein